MAQLIVRDITSEVVNRLKQRAASHGRSAEAEHREILKAALMPGGTRSIKSALAAFPNVGRDSDFKRNSRVGRQVKL